MKVKKETPKMRLKRSQEKFEKHFHHARMLLEMDGQQDFSSDMQNAYQDFLNSITIIKAGM